MKFRENRAALGWLWQVSGSGKWNMLCLVLVQAVLGGSTVVFAWFLRGAIDGAVDKERDTFVFYVTLLLVVVVIQLALRALKRFLDEYTKSSMENRLKERLLTTLMNRDYASVKSVHSAEWMNRLTSDTQVVAEGMTSILPDLMGMAVRMLGALGMILILAPAFGWVLIPGGILLLAASTVFRKKLKTMHKDIREADGRLRVLLSERLSSLIIVRTFAREEQTVGEVKEKMADHRKTRMKRNRFSNLCNVGFGVIMNGVYLAAIVYCGYSILLGTMTYGSFTAMLQMISQIQAPFANITGYLPKFYAMMASAERLMEAESYELSAPGGTWSAEAVGHFYEEDFAAIGLENAAFTYLPHSGGRDKSSEPEVFCDLNLRIGKGEFVAFAGQSGSGKSTILKLLMGLYVLDEGSCYLEKTDGTRMSCTPQHTRLFAYVPQGNYLMTGTIRELVAFGDREKMDDETALWRALSIACADGFTRELKDGLDTLLGERGTGLSEGQMQRIAIARAICSDHPILILDEATSALDETTEGRLLENLRTMTDKTVLVVTHRPAALAVCHRQVSME